MRCILGNLFISEVFIPEAGLLTVTKVIVTDDLKLAKIYLSFLEKSSFPEDFAPWTGTGARPACRLEGGGGVSASAHRAARVSYDTPGEPGAS